MAQLFNIDSPNDACTFPDETCLLAYRGSKAHNMYVPNTDPHSIDDVDIIGVVVAPPECYLGLSQWGSRGTKEYKQGKWDCVFYDIKKMFDMLLHGNPNVMSLLWTRYQEVIIRNPTGTAIRDNRQLFVGKHLYAPFAGYAKAQLLKMESRDPAELREYLAITAELRYRGIHPNEKGVTTQRPVGYVEGEEKNAFEMSDEKLLAKMHQYHRKGKNIGYLGDKRKHLVLEYGFDSKNAAHCIRLLKMCTEFLLSGEMTVYRENDREELLDIKRGKWALPDIKKYAEQLFQEAKDAYSKSTLPEEPDLAGAEALLVRLLLGSFKETGVKC